MPQPSSTSYLPTLPPVVLYLPSHCTFLPTLLPTYQARLHEALHLKLSTLLLALQHTNGTADVAERWGVPPAAQPTKLPPLGGLGGPGGSATVAHLATSKGA